MRRHERASTLLTSNRPVEDWGRIARQLFEKLGDGKPRFIPFYSQIIHECRGLQSERVVENKLFTIAQAVESIEQRRFPPAKLVCSSGQPHADE